MALFVRKNELVISGTFVAADGSNTAPTNAEVVVVYPVGVGTQSATIPMTKNVTTGVWSATWDSSASDAGRVEWMAHCWGGLVAATEGSFELAANSANTA